MEQDSKSKTNQKAKTKTRRSSESQKPQLASNATQANVTAPNTPAAGKGIASKRISIVKAAETPESVVEPPPREPTPPEPTHETDPDRSKVFLMLKMEKELTALLEERMQNVTKFDIDVIKSHSRALVHEARAKAKQCGASERYAYVAQVHIGEVDGTGLTVNSKCLWDPNNDNYARAEYRNLWNIFSVLTVYALYKD